MGSLRRAREGVLAKLSASGLLKGKWPRVPREGHRLLSKAKSLWSLFDRLYNPKMFRSQLQGNAKQTQAVWFQPRHGDVQQVFALTASYVGAHQLRIRQLVVCVLDIFVQQLVLCVLDSFFGYR